MHLHVISFDIPYPANYGGVIDVYYKLVWLHKLGLKIHLHCFEYGRKHAKELEAVCEKVSYYPRNTGFMSHLSLLPYTVKSRISTKLRARLLKDEAPILCEVLHTCYLFNDPAFKNRFKIYRHSNIEHHYYQGLAKVEKNFFKRMYLHIEAKKLQKFESVVNHVGLVLAVNEHDANYYRKKYPAVRTEYLPSFHANEKVNIKEGRGQFILFHGNLSVGENIEAVEWLIKNVFSKITQKVMIAGLNPPLHLNAIIDSFEHMELISNPSHAKMKELIQEAHQHLLYTKQATGLKLKLLNVLFEGRHIICNTEMIKGSGVVVNESICIANTANQMIEQIQINTTIDFTKELIIKRQSVCQPFNNQINAKKIVNFL